MSPGDSSSSAGASYQCIRWPGFSCFYGWAVLSNDAFTIERRFCCTTPTTATFETLISYVTQLVTAAVGWLGQYSTVVLTNPILLLTVITSLVGLGVGLMKRLMKLR